MTMLRMAKITKRFGGTLALDRASLEVRAAEVHALLGENGSGKSTLMKIAAGLIRPDAGHLELEGRPVAFRSPREAAEAGVAIVHQELNLVPAMSAAENLFLGQEPRTRFGLADHGRMRREAQRLFDELEVEIDPRVPVGTLPVATRQMVEIARALTRPMRLLILDEPTSALGESEARVLFGVVRRLRDKGAAIVYISHKMAELFALADRYTVLRDGHTVDAGVMAETTEQALVQSMVGRELGDYYPERKEFSDPNAAVPEPESTEPVLRVSRVSRPGRGAGRRWLVEDVSFEVRRGEIVGIAGLVGAGRTELLEVLFGAAGRGWSGEIEVRGRRVHPRSPAEAIRAGIALVTEDRGSLGILRGQSVLANATVVRMPRLTRAGLVSRRLERDALARQSEVMRIRRASDDIPIESLSGGNQQKVILARWLMNDPAILLLDEPTRGIDVGAKAEIYRVLRRLADSGVGVLFASSELPEVLGLADRILVMAQGRITAEFAAAGASEAEVLAAAMPSAATAAGSPTVIEKVAAGGGEQE